MQRRDEGDGPNAGHCGHGRRGRRQRALSRPPELRVHESSVKGYPRGRVARTRAPHGAQTLFRARSRGGFLSRTHDSIVFFLSLPNVLSETSAGELATEIVFSRVSPPKPQLAHASRDVCARWTTCQAQGGGRVRRRSRAARGRTRPDAGARAASNIRESHFRWVLRVCRRRVSRGEETIESVVKRLRRPARVVGTFRIRPNRRLETRPRSYESRTKRKSLLRATRRRTGSRS